MATAKARPGRHFCKRHQQEYSALEQCAKCKTDPGSPPSEAKIKLPKPPKGCVTAAAREAWFVALANTTLRDVERLTKAAKPKARKSNGGEGATDPEGDWHLEIAIKAHRDTAIKAMRAAQELGAKREEADLVEARRVANVVGAS